jgi:hypothetical protein
MKVVQMVVLTEFSMAVQLDLPMGYEMAVRLVQ